MTQQPPNDHGNSEDHGPVVSPQRARQGRGGVRILVVLAVSLILIVLIYMLLWGGTQEELGELETAPEEAAAARTFEGDASAPPLPSDGEAPATPE
ncbi:MAG: hypothetical protein ACI8U3_001332 [Brevundimonas sp.]|jgi:hypothetical protein|uniref:hypothetical protein n=1 Tax=Brevundimonas sp. TaxID=1871086 RepID=UPI0039E3439D